MSDLLTVSIDDIPQINLNSSISYMVVFDDGNKRVINTFNMRWLHWIDRNLIRLLCTPYGQLFPIKIDCDIRSIDTKQIFINSIGAFYLSCTTNKDIYDLFFYNDNQEFTVSDTTIIFDKHVVEKILKERTGNNSLLNQKDLETRNILSESEYQEYIKMSENNRKL